MTKPWSYYTYIKTNNSKTYPGMLLVTLLTYCDDWLTLYDINIVKIFRSNGICYYYCVPVQIFLMEMEDPLGFFFQFLSFIIRVFRFRWKTLFNSIVSFLHYYFFLTFFNRFFSWTTRPICVKFTGLVEHQALLTLRNFWRVKSLSVWYFEGLVNFKDQFVH